ncbi:Ribonuclease 3 [Fusarium acutatum]|uniref:Ribonuclease 3 n=1 Tax=Fusarium acutatum TaxID=78861 RepID=A0A8H4K1T2_9HYPO|nr:Ribonuclease 3 [Fusarium acutatum]
MTFCANFSQRVSECESIITCELSSKLLCAEALNRAADANLATVIDGSSRWTPKNDRLAAVYGDPAAAYHLCSLWIKRGLSNHCWTTIRGDLISNSNLAKVRKERGLDKCINMNGGSGYTSPAMVATAVEAILGAVEIDGGHEALARIMDHLGLTKHALLASVPPQVPREFRCNLNAWFAGFATMASQERPGAAPSSLRLASELAL